MHDTALLRIWYMASLSPYERPHSILFGEFHLTLLKTFHWTNQLVCLACALDQLYRYHSTLIHVHHFNSISTFGPESSFSIISKDKAPLSLHRAIAVIIIIIIITTILDIQEDLQYHVLTLDLYYSISSLYRLHRYAIYSALCTIYVL